MSRGHVAKETYISAVNDTETLLHTPYSHPWSYVTLKKDDGQD